MPNMKVDNTLYGVSFVLPMFNERENIKRTIKTLKRIAGGITDDPEIIIVDDGSTDGCGQIVERMAAEDPVLHFHRLEKNTRFGGAFARGFKSATRDVIMYMDSDLPVSEDDIKRSFPLIERADIVTGYSRIKKGDTLKRKVMSATYNALVRALFGLGIKDINSGFKIVRRSLVEDMEFISKSPFVDVELFLHAAKKNARVKQFALLFHPRLGGKSHMGTPAMILATFRDMLKVRFLSRR
ncbi:MAG: glycosyltransferase [Candidatus Omnitrophica bacterium]|nr:glycosyltransferase [Candidatus Omnitrophota bacterium]